jgi:hypothetical protein
MVSAARLSENRRGMPVRMCSSSKSRDLTMASLDASERAIYSDSCGKGD